MCIYDETTSLTRRQNQKVDATLEDFVMVLGLSYDFCS